MKTLVFCTVAAVGDDPLDAYWRIRAGRWVDAIQSSRLRADQVLLVDDGSEVLPQWSDTEIRRRLNAEQSAAPVVMYHFDNRLGRQSDWFPGWYRSFSFAALYAFRYGFEKVVHIESDAFLISDPVQDYVNGLTAGWTSLWCPRHNIPESSIQIIAGDQMRAFLAMQAQPYEDLRNRGVIENILPFTHVEKRFKGDRYAESNPSAPLVPRDADYVAQTVGIYPDSFFWWLKPAAEL